MESDGVLSSSYVPTAEQGRRRFPGDNASMNVLASGDATTLYRPCADCGRRTGNFCETMIQQGAALWQGGVCMACDRMPDEQWAAGQRTPLCRKCEDHAGACHYCRTVPWCRPFATGNVPDESMCMSADYITEATRSEEHRNDLRRECVTANATGSRLPTYMSLSDACADELLGVDNGPEVTTALHHMARVMPHSL